MMRVQSFVHSTAAFVHFNLHYRTGVSFRTEMIHSRHPSRRKRNCSSPLTMLSTSAAEDDRTAGSIFMDKKFCMSLSENIAYRSIESEIASQYSIALVSKSEASLSSYTHCIHILPYEYHSVQSYAIGIQPLETAASNKRRGSRKKKNVTQMQPIFIDFFPPLNSSLGKRVGGQRQGGEMLLKAVAPAKYADEKGGGIIYDLTAGFGQDSMILAAGKTAQVHMVERDPIVSLLLKDAMRRLHLISEHVEEDRCDSLYQKLVLHEDDAVDFCKKKLNELNDGCGGIAEAPDVCYLDPMFPPRTKSAAVKKNMQILHGLFQTNEGSKYDEGRRYQEQELLKQALKLAKSRVVVKRPVNATPLGTSSEISIDNKVPLPSFELKGSINRFDVYIL